MDGTPPTPAEQGAPERPRRLPWETPRLVELPPLTELTLQTGSKIPGGGGGGGTVF